MSLAEQATALGFDLAWRTTRLLPEKRAYQLAERLADRVYARNGRDVRQLRHNYALVRPECTHQELEDLVRAGVRSYLRYWCEAFRLPALTHEQLDARVETRGDRDIRAELAAGRPAIIFLFHSGNWDLLAAYGVRHFGTVVSVAERLKPESLYRKFLAFRESLGMTIFPLTGDSDVAKALLAELNGPIVMPLLADRDLSGTGLPMQVCGHTINTAVGPAVLSVRSGAALFPLTIAYEPDASLPGGWRTVATFYDRVEDPKVGSTKNRIAAMTKACTDIVAQSLRTQTEDWHMMQPVFTDDPVPSDQERPS